MNKCLHIIQIPFTGVGWNGGFRGDLWYNRRVEIFVEYTLRSLKSQTNKDFLLWVTFRPQEASHPLTQKLADMLRFHGIKYIFTFQGLMYWDDRFNTTWRYKKIALVRLWRSRRRYSLKAYLEIFENRNSSLVERLKESLTVINKATGDADWVYLTRLDSDDMILPDVVERIQKIPPFRGAITMTPGYIYNTKTKNLAEWNPTTNPPFFTIIFPGKTFFNPLLHFIYWGGYKSHEDIPNIYETKELSGRNYIVGIHDSHISTTWNHRFRGPDTKETFEQVMGS